MEKIGRIGRGNPGQAPESSQRTFYLNVLLFPAPYKTFKTLQKNETFPLKGASPKQLL